MLRRFAPPLMAVACALAVPAAAPAKEVPAPLVELYLKNGTLTDAEAALQTYLRLKPKDAEARFGLGAVRFLLAVEHLVQGLHRHGMHNRLNSAFFLVGGDIPFLRLPVPENSRPEPVTAAKLRAVFERWVDDLEKARTTLEEVPPGPVKMRIDLNLIRLDLNGDGKAAADESLMKLAGSMIPGMPTNGRRTVCFDEGDVMWLRGYCHLLAAMGEIPLAYDFSEVIPACGHLFFAKVDGPHDFLTDGKKVFTFGSDVDIADIIALVHLVRMPVKEPKRMAKALDHLERMIGCSRDMWKLITAETDDEDEWLPNANQKSGLTGQRLNNQMIGGWLDFLDEAEALLKGKKLLPFWRGTKDVGVNLRKVFTDPRPLDIVLWVQGTAATPYLEKGEMTQNDTWRRFERLFHGNFIGFAVWIN